MANGLSAALPTFSISHFPFAMISLTCMSCKKVLEIDDAFAGGVCRCQYCGTIQTVPANLKRGGRPTPGAPATPKTLYQKKLRPPGNPNKSSSGLEAFTD